MAALAKALGSLRFGDPNSQTSTSDLVDQRDIIAKRRDLFLIKSYR
ncbi:MAG: hypothetical protein ACJ73N_11070 [Bryobacteraceae bacterium]